jgi:hypothetical protein
LEGQTGEASKSVRRVGDQGSHFHLWANTMSHGLFLSVTVAYWNKSGDCSD